MIPYTLSKFLSKQNFPLAPLENGSRSRSEPAELGLECQGGLAIHGESGRSIISVTRKSRIN
jgi:hypothetical protein